MVVMLAIIMMMVSVMSLKHSVKIISVEAMLGKRSRHHSTNAADPTMMMMVMLIYHMQDKRYSQEIMTSCDLFSRNVICRR